MKAEEEEEKEMEGEGRGSREKKTPSYDDRREEIEQK